MNTMKITKNKNRPQAKKERLQPISLYPLEVEEALEDILSIKPMGKNGDSGLEEEDCKS